MASIANQIALVTGASSGIGEACARAFAGAGAHVILAARRIERVEKLANELRQEHSVETLPIALDVRDRAAVQAALGGLPERWAPVDILLNNAGLARGLNKVHEGVIDDWDEMIDTNVKGLLYVTRAVLPGMAQRKRGHVINLGSIAGKEVYPNGAVYCASKAAVDFITRGLRMDLCGANVRVTSIDPGMVETEFSQVRFHGDEERAEKVYKGFQPLTAADVAEVILFCVTRPPHINIQDVLLMSTAQASATMTYRE